MRRQVVVVLLLGLAASLPLRAQDASDFPRDQLPGGARDMRLLMQAVQTVTLTRNVNGALQSQRVLRSRIPTCCPSCVNLDGQHYYDSIATANRDVAYACANRSPVGVERETDTHLSELCRRNSFLFFDRNLTNRVHYHASRQADGIHLRMKLRFDIPSSVPAPRRSEMLTQARSCIPKMRNVWNRYGIFFDLTFDSNHENTPGTPHQSIDLVDTMGRSNTGRFHFRGNNNFSTSDDFCLMLLHETGHLLGLDDEYADADCPDRPFVSRHTHPTSVMNDEYVGWNDIDFFPSHVRAIVAPLCP